MSPRRNARALAPRPKRHAASGKTRALGQHFLRDSDVARRIVELARPTAGDLALVLATVVSVGYWIVEHENVAYRAGAYTALVALALGDNLVNPEVATAQFRVEAAP